MAFALLTAVAVRASGDVESITKLMPSDYPLTAVVVNFEKLDKGVTAFGKAVDPTSEPSGLLTDMKRQVGVAEWVDFTKPVGIIQASFNNSEPVLWASIPKFAEKVKEIEGAKEEDGVWFVPFEGKDDLFVMVKGDVVIAGLDKSELTAMVQKEGKRFADEIRPRMDLLKDRDALIHLNFESVRPMVSGQLAQAGQMAPMMAMMAAQQGGMDATALTAVFTGVVEGLKTFVEQAAYVDIAVGISESAVNTTIAAGFSDGTIKSYLAKTKPAASPLVACFEDEPFSLAMGWHVPGAESPFFDFVFEKMAVAAPAPAAQPAGEGGDKPASAEADASKEAMQVLRDLMRKMEGQNTLMRVTDKGLVSKGSYIGDSKVILDLAKQTLTKVNPLSKSFGGGASYEPSGTKDLGGTTVDQYTLKFDPNHPASAQAAKMFGENNNILFGVAGGLAAYYMGPEAEAKQYFSGKVGKPLTENKQVAEAVAALPSKRNALLLVDIAGSLPAILPMLGMPAPSEIPAGPPVALSVLLSGDYARVDVHVPSKAIQRVVQATSSQPPM